jgi:iron complex outermembrane receptor protein
MRFINKIPVVLLFSSFFIPATAVNAQGGVDVLEEVIVTGSFIKRKNQSDSTSPIQVISSDAIDDLGAFTNADLINTLTVNAGAQNNNDGFNQTFSLGTTNVNLRGLGVSSTLTLLNGRRQAVTAATTLNGDQFTDLNSLVPSIAIDRVEILEDGASTLYGSDAVAGVANFLTRKGFEGLELEINHKTTDDDGQDDTQISLFGGHSFGNTNVIAALSIFDRSPLSAADRRDEFELRNANSTFGSPGTFLVFKAGPPQRVLDPSCLAVTASNPETTIGPVPPGNCGFDFGDFFRLVAEEERVQSYVELNTTFDNDLQLFVELGYTANDVVTTGSPSQPILFPPFIPTINPAFSDPALAGVAGGTGALFFGRVAGSGSAPSQVEIESDTYRVSAGLKGDFNDVWSWQTSFGLSENTYNYYNDSDTLVDRFSAALVGLGGPNNNQFFNPIFGAANDPAVREDFRGVYAFEATSKLGTLDAIASGSIGSVGVAGGIQLRNSELEYDYSDAAENDNLYFFRGNRSFKDDEDVAAIFVEADIPVSENLNIQAALRYEDLGDFDSTDPKLGFLWRKDQLSVRGTVSTSFRAPSIFQKAGGMTVPARIVDPVAGGFATVSQRTESSATTPLRPQESDALNFGFTWESSGQDLSISTDYWRFDYSDFITPENATAVVNANPSGPQITRVGNSPTGALIAVTTLFRNAGSLKTDGIDLSVSKDFGETLRATLDASYILSYDLDDPVSGQLDGLGQRNFTNFGVPTPELRWNVGLLWAKTSHSANMFYRFIDSYIDENNTNAEIDTFGTLDVQYAYQFSNLFGDESEAQLLLGVKNLTDEQAPDVASRSGYDSLTHNPLGRQFYLSVKLGF